MSADEAELKHPDRQVDTAQPTTHSSLGTTGVSHGPHEMSSPGPPTEMFSPEEVPSPQELPGSLDHVPPAELPGNKSKS